VNRSNFHEFLLADLTPMQVNLNPEVLQAAENISHTEAPDQR
jgi:hypothetical protein